MNDIYTWHNDLYPLVKKRFDLRYAKRLNVINRVCDVICQDDVDYRIEGVGGYGEMPVYNGSWQRRNQRRRYRDFADSCFLCPRLFGLCRRKSDRHVLLRRHFP